MPCNLHFSDAGKSAGQRSLCFTYMTSCSFCLQERKKNGWRGNQYKFFLYCFFKHFTMLKIICVALFVFLGMFGKLVSLVNCCGAKKLKHFMGVKVTQFHVGQHHTILALNIP